MRGEGETGLVPSMARRRGGRAGLARGAEEQITRLTPRVNQLVTLLENSDSLLSASVVY
jgi:hypothetical protein